MSDHPDPRSGMGSTSSAAPVPVPQHNISTTTSETVVQTPPAPNPGQPGVPGLPGPLPVIPRYELIERLGEGGMGVVYRARQTELRREVAVKVIRPEMLTNPRAVTRFQREMRAAAQLKSHPNVVMVHDAGQVGALHYFSMELVEGVDLGQLLARVGSLPVRQACKYILDAAQGLQHAHRHLIHRDIKPSNLIVVCPVGAMPSADDRVQIVDFGLARLTEAEDNAPGSNSCGQLLGTGDYMAPEQADNPSGVDVRADLYSLGCTLYHLLTGRVPFPGGSLWQKLDRHRREEPTPAERLRPEVPPPLATVLRRLMAKRPDDRYGRPAEVVAILEALIRGSDSPPPLPPLPPPAPPPAPPRAEPPRQWEGHTGWVTGVAVAPNSRWLVSASLDDSLAVWDVARAERIGSLAGHTGPVTAVAIAPDGAKVVSGSDDKKVRLWDLATHKEVRRFEGHLDHIFCVCCSPDGRWIASGGRDRTVRLWEAAGGWEKMRYEAHEGVVNAVAFAPDGRSLASGSEDGVVRVWQLHTIHPLAESSQPAGPVRALAWSPDGRFVVYAANHLVYVWHPETGATTALLANHTDTVLAVACTPDGRHILSGGMDGTVRLWDLHYGRKLHVFEGPLRRVMALAVAPDGSFAVSGGDDRVVRRHDLPTAPEPTHPPATALPSVPGARPGSRPSLSGRLQIISRLATLEGHAAPVTSVRFDPHSAVIVSAGWDHTVRLWDRHNGWECQRFLGHRDIVWKAIVLTDGRHVVSAGQDGTIRLWDRHSAADLGRFPPLPAAVNDIVLSWDDVYLVSAGDDRLIRVWEVASGREVRHLAGHADEVTRVALSRDMSELASCSRDGTVRLWDFRTGRLMRTLLERNAGVMTRALTFSPDGSMLASGGWDGVARLWETDTGREICRLRGASNEAEPEAVHSVAFSPNGKWLLTGCGGRDFRYFNKFQPGTGKADNAVRLWTVPEGVNVGNAVGHTGPVTRVAFSPDGTLAVSSSYDRTVRLWTVPGDKQPR